MSPHLLTFLVAAAWITAAWAEHRSHSHEKFLSRRYSAELGERRVSSASLEVDELPGHHRFLATHGSLVLTKLVVARVIFTAACLLFFGAAAYLIMILLTRFNDIKGTKAAKSWLFQDYLAYRFAYWITWSNWSYSVVMVSLAAFFMLVGTSIYWAMVRATISSSAWKVFLALMDPSGGRDEKTMRGAFVCGLMSIFGLGFFALTLTFIQQRFDQYMHRQTLGIYPVMEKGHVVVIGLTAESMMLLQQLANAYENEGGVAIAVLSEKLSKPDMEEKIRALSLDLGASRVIVRTGNPQLVSGLESVAVSSARRVILMADPILEEKELRDAFVMQSLLAMLSQGWPEAGRILVECSLVRNKDLFKCLGGERTDIVMTDYLVSQLFIQISSHGGLGNSISNSFSFRGSVFQVGKVPPHLVGKSIIEASMHYPAAVPVGIIKPDGECSFGGNAQLESGGDILLLGECKKAGVVANAKPCHDLEKKEEHLDLINRQSTPRISSKPETIFILGWGAFIGILLVHLDYVVCKGTRVVLISTTSKHKRKSHLENAQRRWRHKLQNITVIEHVIGPLGSRLLLDDLKTPLEQASRIFVLSDNCDVRESDAYVIAAVQQIRNVLSDKACGRAIPIIPEIRDSRSDHLCSVSLADDFLDASGLPLRFLACVAYEYKLQYAIESMLSEKGSVWFQIRKLSEFVFQSTADPQMVSFAQVQDLVASAGSVALGWSVASDAPRAGQEGELVRTMTDIFNRAHGAKPIRWEVNPSHKTVARPWTEDDRVIVLEPRFNTC